MLWLRKNGVKCKASSYEVFWEVIYAYFCNWDGSHDLVLIVYALVELIIAASHQAGWIDIHTQHTSLCSMNAIFICVIVLVKMYFHMLNLCWFKHKNILKCFRCFWKVLCFYKNWKISKTVLPYFGDSVAGHPSHEIQPRARVLILATCLRVKGPVARGTQRFSRLSSRLPRR